ncbi:MAG: QacE family quaternary ammonium compound efflux SMR transporter [Flavobacteriales bacterium]|nr:QacE family quaternary ammonium compound efflux SMR transporter [Flavobacteriales bacterium]
MSHWIILLFAGLFETAFATCLGQARLAEGSARTGWLIGFVACLAVSMLCSVARPIGTAAWTGIGAAGTVIVGIALFKEPADSWRLFFLFTLIASIVGLKAFAK